MSEKGIERAIKIIKDLLSNTRSIEAKTKEELERQRLLVMVMDLQFVLMVLEAGDYADEVVHGLDRASLL